MKIPLTGSNGEPGFELEHSPQNVGEVIALDRRRLDLSDTGQVKKILREIRLHVSVNAAACTAVVNADKEETSAIRINAEVPGVMAEEVRHPEYSVLAKDKHHSALGLRHPQWETALDFFVSTW